MPAPEQVRDLLSTHGETRPQSISDWRGPFPLPPALEVFYLAVRPLDITIAGDGNPYFLPRLSELWNFQAGYSYHAYTGEALNIWQRNWLVVAAEGSDPFIFDSNTEAILYDFVGRGHWDPDEAFPDLNSMAACLASIGSVVVGAGEDLTDDENYIKEKYCLELTRRLEGGLETPAQVASVLARLGCERFDELCARENPPVQFAGLT